MAQHPEGPSPVSPTSSFSFIFASACSAASKPLHPSLVAVPPSSTTSSNSRPRPNQALLTAAISTALGHLGSTTSSVYSAQTRPRSLIPNRGFLDFLLLSSAMHTLMGYSSPYPPSNPLPSTHTPSPSPPPRSEACQSLPEGINTADPWRSPCSARDRLSVAEIQAWRDGVENEAEDVCEDVFLGDSPPLPGSPLSGASEPEPPPLPPRRGSCEEMPMGRRALGSMPPVVEFEDFGDEVREVIVGLRAAREWWRGKEKGEGEGEGEGSRGGE